MYLAATAQDGLAHVLDDARQLVRTDVGVRIAEDAGAGPVLTEDAQKERTLRVEIAMGRDAAKHLLEHLTTVRSVELLPSQTPGVTAAFITGAYDAMMEHELFQALKKQDAAIMHLSTVKNALEEVFISTLTAQPDEGVQA